jgi:hypothetical protein
MKSTCEIKELVVPLLSKALSDSSEEVRSQAAHGLIRLGRALNTEDVGQLESQIQRSPDELGLRILALGYYDLGQRESNSARAARWEHIFWLIRHAPECATAGSPRASIHEPEDRDAYVRGKELWLEQVAANPEKATILGNAADFVLLYDRELCETLLKKARDLEPSNPHWPERLGHLYSLQFGRDAPRAQANARSALEEFRAAEQTRLAAEPDAAEIGADADKAMHLLARIHALPQLAKAAFDAREFEEARNFARELLSSAASSDLPEFFRNGGNAVHHGNLILGRVALQSGDLIQARERLIAAGRTSGSPQLNSFGPNMAPARELLERGERGAVLEFFDLCEKFWQHGSDRLGEWKRQVNAGEVPEFGPNLRY